MIPNIYEILNKFQSLQTKEERKHFLLNNQYKHFLEFLNYTFNPNIQFYPTEFPKDYKKPDTFPGIRIAGLESEIRKTYLFIKGNPTADTLTPEKRYTLLLQLLESFEPDEAIIYVKMLQKNLNIPHLNYKLIKETLPNLLP